MISKRTMNKIVLNRDGNKWLINGKELSRLQSGILSIILYPFIVMGLLIVSVCMIIFAVATVAVAIAGLPILLLPSLYGEMKEIYGRKNK